MAEMTIKQRVQENGRQIAKQLRVMPKCKCGHSRIKHGVYCDASCVANYCECSHYNATQNAESEENKDES